MVRVLCYGHKSYKFESYTCLKKKQSKSDAVASRQQETLLRDMQQKVLHFDCRSKIWGSIPPYLFFFFSSLRNLTLCVKILEEKKGRKYQKKKSSKTRHNKYVSQSASFFVFISYFLLILISLMVEQDTSNIQVQVRVLNRSLYILHF